MQYKSDIEIAQACQMEPITEIAKIAGVDEKYLELYGRYKAKINYSILREEKRFFHLIARFCRVGQHNGVFCHRLHNADDVRLLRAVCPDRNAGVARRFAKHVLSGQEDHREIVLIRAQRRCYGVCSRAAR